MSRWNITEHRRRNRKLIQIRLAVGNGMGVLYQVDPELLLRYFIFCWWHVTVVATGTKVVLYDCLIANNFLFIGYLLMVNHWQFTWNDRGRMRIWIRSVYVFTFAYSHVDTWQFRGMVTDSIGMPCERYFNSDAGCFLYEDLVIMLLESHECDKWFEYFLWLPWWPVMSKEDILLDAFTAHDGVIKWKHIPRYWRFVRGIHRNPVNCPHKGQWCGALMFTLSCARINGWVNNREAGDLRRHRAHYDVIVIRLVMLCLATFSSTVISLFVFWYWSNHEHAIYNFWWNIQCIHIFHENVSFMWFTIIMQA